MSNCILDCPCRFLMPGSSHGDCAQRQCTRTLLLSRLSWSAAVDFLREQRCKTSRRSEPQFSNPWLVHRSHNDPLTTSSSPSSVARCSAVSVFGPKTNGHTWRTQNVPPPSCMHLGWAGSVLIQCARKTETRANVIVSGSLTITSCSWHQPFFGLPRPMVC
jgi:hypothetical protein